MKHIAILLAACIFLLTTPKAYSRQSIEQNVTKALDLIDQGAKGLETNDPQAPHYLSQAAALLEAATESHEIINPGIYHALGNAYMLNHDLGNAILAYRRGELIDPHHARIQHALNSARSQVAIQTQPSTTNRAMRFLRSWRNTVSSTTLLYTFLICSAFGWLSCTARVLNLGPPRLAKLGTILIACASLPFALLSVEWYAAEHANELVITDSHVIARSGPDDTIYAPAFEEQLLAGVEGTLVESRDDWYQIELADGSRCWIPSESATLINP